jgi:lipid-binding SYLF domain-containing protein
MKQTIRLSILTALLLASAFPVLTTLADDADLYTEAGRAIKVFERADSGLTNLFNRSAGFAVFPSVGKGGFIFGAEHGNGLVYENGKPIGEATLTEINVGPQAGGEAFYEVIFFETADALANFKQSNFEMSAKVSVAVAAEGASINAKYRNGVIVFTLPKSGLMAQVSVGGQKFKFKAIE